MWIHVSKARSWSIGPIAAAKLTLPQLDHPFTAVFSTSVRMCTKGGMLGAKSWTWAKRVASSRLFMVTSPVGLVSVTSRACAASEKGDIKTNHWP